MNFWLLIVHHSVDVILLHFRHFLKSKWGMEAFLLADTEAGNRGKNFIITVLKDKLQAQNLTPEIKKHMGNAATFVDATGYNDNLLKAIRFE